MTTPEKFALRWWDEIAAVDRRAGRVDFADALRARDAEVRRAALEEAARVVLGYVGEWVECAFIDKSAIAEVRAAIRKLAGGAP